jgi:RNA polymerase sigma-70 factor (ECF subfamily)
VTTQVDEARRAAERVARESYGRLVAFLAARTRDVAGAEDALAEAFAAALQRWPRDGVPQNPDAWLLTVARRRQTDAGRRRQTRTAGETHLMMIQDEIEEAAMHPDEVPDRRLAVMFACAHPAVERGMRAPLILQTILGLTAVDIAAAFLIPPSTMGQRLVRAKIRIRDTGVPFRVPEKEELPERLDAVLEAIYAAYAKGWGEIEESGTPALADEAVWLARLVVSLLPDEPEAKGMLALMLYAEARRPARRDPGGAYVPLEAQETALWDEPLIDAAEALHLARRLRGTATWPAIVALYDHLLTLTRSPVVVLNRAAALAELEGAEAALAAIAPLAADRRMDSYQPYWAAKGHFAALAGQKDEAHEALRLAIGLSTDPAVRRYLQTRLEALRDG